MYVEGVCTFLSSVLLQQEFGDGQINVTAQFYLASKGKYILET